MILRCLVYQTNPDGSLATDENGNLIDIASKKEEIEKPKRETGGGPRRDPKGKRSRAPQTK